MKNLFKIVFFLISFTGIFAQSQPKVLATNTWTAAFVEMAGGEAETLAPADMTHPPEYELKISDVAKIRDADLLVYAGYEVLMKSVFESFEKPENQMIRISTSYAPAVLEESVLAIAEKLGTTSLARENIKKYKSFISESRNLLKKNDLFGKTVLVNFHQRPLVESLGFSILGVFGPQPLSPADISKLGKMNPDLIIDNIHNPIASPLEEILNRNAVILINFPQYPMKDGTRAPAGLLDVARFNVDRILDNN